MQREIDQRVKAFGEYLEERIAEQKERPYSEREDIERRLQVYERAGQLYEELVVVDSGGRAIDQKLYEKPISELELSVRAGNCLEAVGIRTVGQLLEHTDGQLLAIRSFGKTSVREVQKKLEELGLSIREGDQFSGPEFPAYRK